MLGYPVETGEPTWLQEEVTFNPQGEVVDFENQIVKIYVASLFHIVQTVTTIGYGNSTGFTLREHTFSIFLLFFGLLTFIFVFENIKSTIKSLNEEEQLENQEAEDLQAWLNKMDRNFVENIDMVDNDFLEFYHKILKYNLDQDWQKLFLNNPQFKHFDNRIREEVLKIGFQQFERKFYIVFRHLSKSFIHQILLLSESHIYTTNEVIIPKGSPSKGIFFILEGTVLIDAGESGDMIFNRLLVDSFFGEASLLEKNFSPFSFILFYSAETELRCLFIDKRVFEELGNNYPKDLKKLKALAYQRQTHFINEKQHYKENQFSEKYMRNKRAGKRRTQIRTTKKMKSCGAISPDERLTQFPLVSGDLKTIDLRKIFPENNSSVVSLVFADYDKDRSSEAGSPEKEYPLRKDSQTLKDIAFKTSENLWESCKSVDRDHVIKPFCQENELPFSSIKEINTERKEDPETEICEEIDELNRSDIFPLESTIPDFTDIAQSKKIISYLEERVIYIQNKIEQMKVRLSVDLQYINQKSKIINKKLFVQESSIIESS